MRIIMLIFIIISFSFCNQNNSKEDSQSFLANLGLFSVRMNRLQISGTAVKGIIKNAIVKINPIDKQGECNNSITLAEGKTDESGKYDLVFNKTDSVVCIIISPNPNGQTTIFDEKLMTDIIVPSNSSFQLTKVIPESKIKNNNMNNAHISPFSKMATKRFQSLVKQADSYTDPTLLYRKASKEIVIRFGLNTGLSALSTRSILNRRAPGATLSDDLYPELEDILFDLEDPASPLSAKFTSIQAGFSQLANTYKNGSSLAVEDIDSITEAFTADFEDGLFDGKTASGGAITIGSGMNQITFSANPLSDLLQPAITTYIQEGGSLSLGVPTDNPIPSISVTEITNQTQFVDNAVITSPSLGLPPTLSYSGSPYIFAQNSPITPLTPTLTGTVTSCTASLPAGLSINNTTCVISGTPSSTQSATSYTITASNAIGNATANISIQINAQITISYPGNPFTFTVGTPISNLTPTVGNGPATSFGISPPIPSGLSFNTTTGVISGTPSVYFSNTAFTITATSSANGTNSTVISMSANIIYNFTNAGQTGRQGPNQAMVTTAYTGTSLDGNVTVTGTGIQQWTVPTTGTYKIEAYGAQGATDDSTIGRGASMIGNFSLTAGQTIWILVGQQGSGTPGVYMNVGGGGGTFVATGASLGSSTPLIVAGGGGGTQICCNQAGSAGSISTSGNAGMNSNTTGGVGGTGGGAGGIEQSSETSAASGFNGSGTSSQSFLTGGLGAVGTPVGTDGGFGGGGAATVGGYSKAGGGGGYSGGGSSGGANGQTFAGGGGGSFNSGTSPVNTAGANPGHGKVIITFL